MNLRSLVVGIALFLPASIIQAQSSVEWLDRQAGAGMPGTVSTGNSCLIDAAGNVYACGVIGSSSSSLMQGDAFLVKYDPSGTIVWSRTRDALGWIDHSSFLSFGAGGVIHEMLTYFGPSTGFSSEVATWDPAGNLLWSRRLPQGFVGMEIAVGPQGELACTAQHQVSSAGVVIGLSPSGQVRWTSAPFGIATLGLGADAQGDWYFAYLYFGPSPQLQLRTGVAKLDAQGQMSWKHDVVGVAGAQFRSLAVAPDGYTVAVGNEIVSASQTAMLAVAHDTAGTPLWTRTWTVGSNSESAYDVVIDEHGVAWVAGTRANGLRVARHSRDGSLLSYGDSTAGLPSNDPMPLRMVLGSARQAYVVSKVSGFADLLVLEIDSEGALTWTNLQPSMPHGGIHSADIALNEMGKLAITGAENPVAGGQVMLTLRLDLNDAPQAYCVAKLNSLGCLPKLGFAGLSSAAATSGFRVIESDTLSGTSGLFLYSTAGKAAVPFQGGTLCMLAPVRRTPGGSSSVGPGCDSTRSLDFNAFASGAQGGSPAPELRIPGTAVHCQAWSRDPGFQPPNATSLSNALRYVVLP